MRDDLPTGTVTFLFTDVEGSTKLLHEFGAEAYAEALSEHRRVIRETCAAEGGVEVDTQGDAFFFAVPTAPGALSAAATLTVTLAPGVIRVRVGLHTGTPLVTDEGYVGDDVHRAARIAAVGHGGQVLVASSTAALVGLAASSTSASIASRASRRPSACTSSATASSHRSRASTARTCRLPQTHSKPAGTAGRKQLLRRWVRSASERAAPQVKRHFSTLAHAGVL